MDRIVIRTLEDRNKIVDWVLDELRAMGNEFINFPIALGNGEIRDISSETLLEFKVREDRMVEISVSSLSSNKYLFSFEASFDGGEIKNKVYSKNVDPQKAKEREKEFDVWRFSLALWQSVNFFVAHYRKEIEKTVKVKGERVNDSKSSKGKKKRGSIVYFRTYTIDPDLIRTLPHEAAHRNGPDHEFGVRGHFRHYRSGKVVWISPYTKCKGRGERLDRTYIAKV